jgi:hypothetical protein
LTVTDVTGLRSLVSDWFSLSFFLSFSEDLSSVASSVGFKEVVEEVEEVKPKTQEEIEAEERRERMKKKSILWAFASQSLPEKKEEPIVPKETQNVFVFLLHLFHLYQNLHLSLQ